MTRLAVGVGGVVVLIIAGLNAPATTGRLLITFSIIVFLWAVVGLLRPQWGRLPNRLAAVWVWAISAGLFVAGAVLLAPPTENLSADPPADVFVSSSTWQDGPWPLTVDVGHLFCAGDSDRPLPWIRTPDDRTWPLNGLSMAAAGRLGAPFQPAITPIQRIDAALMAQLPPGASPVRLSTDGLRRLAVTLPPCGGPR